ncbi:AMP-binding protein [Aestuariivita boseongensis]|uniref:AMP-binding protein n=1 Tax=Aestuariivita boseongensis TaxID=1470562 RepID=UPI000682F8E3|nr:AMP-binding protein [Aestuariivita boseongensis]
MVYDPRIPAKEECVLAYQLEHWAARKPDDLFVSFEGGPRWSWAETLDQTRRAAAAFQAMGVKKGDHVLSWQPNSWEALLTWFGLNYLGAVYVPVNVAYKGALLEHVVKLSDAKLMVCHADLLDRLAQIDCGVLSDVIVTGGEATLDGFTCHPASALQADTGLPGIPEEIAPWDTQYIIFTSGTTGPSKAVLSSYVQGHAMGPVAHDYTEESDHTLVNLPLFHVGGTVFFNIALGTGSSCHLDTHFKTDVFWDTVRREKITNTLLLGAIITFLNGLPERDDDQDHTLKKSICVPWNDDARKLGKRHGITVRTTFNMTEISSPMVSDPYPPENGTCGVLRPGVEARVVDENDCELPPGVAGELIVRTDTVWGLNHGYYKNPEATAKAWRNGWFHTGDAFKYDEAGYFYFVDRIKDAIRRRGENISSFEVEAEVNAHPDVAESAAVPVPSAFNEDEVLVVVVPAKGRTIDPEALFDHLRDRMAHFMLPHYIRVIDDLPKTPTQKVQKHILRDAGVTKDTWNREAAGITVKREKIGS